MKSRLTLASFLLLAFTLGLPGQEKPDLNDKKTPAPKVSEEEIRSQRVEFINASNAPATEEQRRQSYDAGRRLADQVVATGQSTIDQVTVQRIFDPATPGFGADIITIDPKANFAHINAIQRIIMGYTQRAYEYTPADSEAVSKFILYYNARLRGKSETLEAKYSEAVMAALKPETAGIDRVYRNWAGRTQIVIPLVKNVVRPGKTDVNTGEIKKETDSTLKKDEKKQLTDLENRRKDDTDKKLDQKQDQLKKEEQKIEQKKEDVRRQQDEVKQQKEDTGKKIQELQRDPVKNAEEIKKQEQKQQEITRTEQDLKKQEEQVKKEETANKQEQKEVKDQKSEPAKTDQTPAKDTGKLDTLKKENEELKKQAEDKEQKSENVVGEKILFLRFLKYHSDGHYSNELWLLDPKKDDTLMKSPYANICGREFVVVQGQGVLVIGYEGTADSSREHLLAMLDSEKLTLKTKSKENIYWRSPLISRDNKIYAFEVKDGQYYLTRFNPDLTVDARSSEPISGDSDVTFYNEKIYVTGKEQTGSVTNIRVFNRADLKHLKTITPPK